MPEKRRLPAPTELTWSAHAHDSAGFGVTRLGTRLAAASSLVGRALLFGLVLAGLFFLAASPIGWVLLLGVLAAFSFSSVTAM
jgi:hypothetical protein